MTKFAPFSMSLADCNTGAGSGLKLSSTSNDLNVGVLYSEELVDVKASPTLYIPASLNSPEKKNSPPS
jgi:predicted small secreted protein